MAHIIGRGGPRDRAAIPLSTKLGTHIENERRRESSPDARRASVRKWATEFPDAKLRSLTATYNCFGMVFANRRAWVFEDQLPLVRDEDGYRLVATPAVGDIVVYRRTTDIEHVGIAVEVRPNVESGTWEVIVLSKWGVEGEYFHRETRVPQLFGRPAEYWTDRVEAP